MTIDLLCFPCLVGNKGHTPAVTVLAGTAACETCARDLQDDNPGLMTRT